MRAKKISVDDCVVGGNESAADLVAACGRLIAGVLNDETSALTGSLQRRYRRQFIQDLQNDAARKYRLFFSADTGGE